MARLARVIAPGMPHHVTQRGNPRQQTFFGEEDYQHYLELMARFYRAEQVAIWNSGPGRPGWLPTQVPHRSGLAHHAHPVPHLMNSRPARSVVGTWTWFRSRGTCQVSLQRLMRRHPLPLTGSLGLVPPLQRYYEVLRLPAALTPR